MSKRPCRFEGCKAFARKGQEYCVAHPDGVRRRVGGAPAGNQNARKHGVYAAYVPVVDLKSALRLPMGDLRLEIAVVRQALVQLLAMDLPPPALLEGLDRATSALVRMMRMNMQLSDDTAGELGTAVDQYLNDLGLGQGGG